MNRILITTLLVVFSVELGNRECEAQVYGNSRHRASANSSSIRRQHAGGVIIGRQPTGRSGRGSGVSVFIPGPTTTASRRPTYSNSRYRIYGHHAVGGIRTYGANPGRVRYSGNHYSIPHIHHDVGPIYPNVYLNFDSVPFGLNSAPYGINPYPTIIAPPIVVPYGGIGPSLQMTAPPFTTIPAAPPVPLKPSKPSPLNPGPAA